MKYECPCCFCLTLDEPPGKSYAICPVCGWEDDPAQLKDIDFAGGANKQSLRQARESYAIREAQIVDTDDNDRS